ncbi:MAG TPA: hypothetical protein H9692_01815 [Firmicutes bacterium]|nr:hypothetical protein [Bacillota bacterium]
MKRSARVVACGAKIPLHVTTWQKFKVAEDEPTAEKEKTLYQAEDNMKRSARVVACGAKMPPHVTTRQKLNVAEVEPTTEKERTL